MSTFMANSGRGLVGCHSKPGAIRLLVLATHESSRKMSLRHCRLTLKMHREIIAQTLGGDKQTLTTLHPRAVRLSYQSKDL